MYIVLKIRIKRNRLLSRILLFYGEDGPHLYTKNTENLLNFEEGTSFMI